MNNRILIVDGHPVYGEKMEVFLQDFDFQEITRVKTGKAALEQLQTKNYSIVLLSGVLADVDSIEVCRKAIEGNTHTGVIVQVGFATTDEVKLAFKTSGADYVIDRKEKDLQPLRSALESLMCKA